MSTTNTTQGAAPAQNPKLKAYEDKIAAQIQDAKAKLQQVEAKAKEKKAAAEIKAVDGLNTAKQNIDQKLKDLKATNAVHVARAKADIDGEVARFKASVDELAAKFKGQPATK
jgi:uncharacterized protein YicC (UPF0701 family)